MASLIGIVSFDGFSATGEPATSFAHSLAPIALVYAAAHYASLLLLQKRGVIPLASDPLGDGSDLFGTAGTTVDYGLIATSTFWYSRSDLSSPATSPRSSSPHDRGDRHLRPPADRDALAILDADRDGRLHELAPWLLSEAGTA